MNASFAVKAVAMSDFQAEEMIVEEIVQVAADCWTLSAPVVVASVPVDIVDGLVEFVGANAVAVEVVVESADTEVAAKVEAVVLHHGR